MKKINIGDRVLQKPIAELHTGTVEKLGTPGSFCTILCDNGSRFYTEANNLEVLENSMRGFKIGDTVLHKNSGEIGTVLEIYKNNCVKIKWEDKYQTTERTCVLELLKSLEPIVSKFNLGDTVEFGGIEGEVTLIDIDADSEGTPVEVSFKDGRIDSFTRDGRWLASHTIPLLNLVKRAPQRVNKVITVYAITDTDGDIFFTSENKSHCEEVMRGRLIGRSVLVELSKTIEIEAQQDE